MLAGVAIQGVVTLIDNYIHRQEKMIAKGKEAKSSINETFAEFSKGKNTLDTLGQSFADNADEIETTGDAIESICYRTGERTIFPHRVQFYLVVIRNIRCNPFLYHIIF